MSRRGSRAIGAGLVLSVPVWWAGLRWWAEAQIGYLEVDALGPAPYLWVLLVLVAALILVVGLLPRTSGPANWTAALLFCLPASALASVNIAGGIGDGISPAGWLLGGISCAQALTILFVLGMGRHDESRGFRGRTGT